MRKIVAFLVCLSIVLSFSACHAADGGRPLGDISDNPNQSEGSDPQNPTDSSNQTNPSGPQDSANGKNDTTKPESAENKLAMEMYEAAIRDEISVIDERLGETKLKDCRFPSDNVRLGDCEFLSKAIVDMDGDGLHEYVIQSEAKDHIVLHYYNGKVYSFVFDGDSFHNLNTDGSFYWRKLSKSEGSCVGLNQLSFDGALLIVKEVYRIIIHPAEKTPIAYYMDGKQITGDEYTIYHNNNPKGFASFSPFDISCEYPISSEDACEIASNHWRTEDGHTEGACGTKLLYRIVISEKPNSYTISYRICLQRESYCRAHHGWESQMPRITVCDELLVNAITGECFNIHEDYPDGK